MSAKILDGKSVAHQIQSELAAQIQKRILQKQRIPGLAVIIVGDDPASQIYVNNKHIACKKAGFHSLAYELPENVGQDEVEELINQLNQDETIDGIIVQTPLPKHLNCARIIDKISYTKDVDGFHPYNVGRLAIRRPLLRPCTPFGIIRLLQHYAIELTGLNAVIVGASNIVGRPMALELLLKKATVTICHRYTKDLAAKVSSADLLVVAIGKRDVILSEWLKQGVIVVDVGINRQDDGKIKGDIEFESAAEKASWITPVPGGVGPMTVTMLLENTLKAAELRN
ncbi:MAG: bifunctional methylenetetrahydrofolate dehydrogenase/methenyltetrahydrofolate cyclohydrolase FolD [Gammaproteobacteria bacterium]|nr:bifunctional methylenetetrahydrofolate dehydrogenase/methenyltetrahydrofolate cyclohydrolase FolD [Gammaproteobacteria bacterium]